MEQSTYCPDRQAVSASRKLSRINLNLQADTVPLEHYWCRVAYQYQERPNLKEHRHSFFELHMCLCGCAEIAVGEQVFTLIPGTFLLLPPDTNHQILSQEPDFSKFVWGFSVKNESMAEMLTQGCMPAGLKQAEPEMHNCVQIMLNNSDGDGFGYYTVIQGQLYHLFALLVRKLTTQKTVESFQKSLSAQMEEIKKYISDNLSANLSAEEIADQFHISRKQLTRICMEECKMTVTQLKNSLQMEKIRQMLEENEKSLEEIACTCGFSDQYSMSKFFHRHEGFAPGKYRKARRL